MNSTSHQPPRASVCICTYNRADYLKDTISSILGQDFSSFELLVIDNNCTDDTPLVIAEASARDPRVRHVPEPRQGLSYARNRGITESSGEIVVFVDDDIVAPRGWLEGLIECFDQTGADAVGGPARAKWEGVPPDWILKSAKARGYLSIFDLGDERISVEDWIVGANMAFHRRVFDRLGAFPEGLDRCGRKLLSGGDVQFCRKVLDAGMEIQYEPAAWVHHRMPRDRQSLQYVSRTAFWNGVSKVAIKRPMRVMGASDFVGVDAIMAASSFLGGIYGRWLRMRGDLPGYEASSE